MSQLPEHPAADIFPLMDPVSLENLADDIASQGLLEPIELFEGKILDGRNRYNACLLAGIPPEFIEVSPDNPLGYVAAKNILRRHLDENQRAAIAARIANMLKGRHGINPPIGGFISQPQAAELMNVSLRSVQRAKRIRESGVPELVKAVGDGALNLSEAEKIISQPASWQKEAVTKLGVHFSSETPEHYTPKVVIDAIITCLGTIDLDPCSNPGDPNVPAHHHYTEADDGLAQNWCGRVFMNPPYGREIGAWVRKLHSEYGEAGRISEAIALVPSRTDTEWFRVLRDYPVCFVAGRLTFIGNSGPAPFPSAIFYLGDNPSYFAATFCCLGDIWTRVC